jgi:hypothetical protein
MATQVAGNVHYDIDGQLSEIKRQLQQKSGYPFSPEQLKSHLQLAVEGEFNKTLPQSLHAAIAACEFDSVHPEITEDNFHLQPVRRELKVFRFQSNNIIWWTEQVLDKMKNEGWSPATLTELLAYAKNEWDGSEKVVALGSKGYASFIRYCAPALFQYSRCLFFRKRCLILTRWKDCCYSNSFLAARD